MKKLLILISFVIVSHHYSLGQMEDSVAISKTIVKAFFADTRQIINGDKKYFHILDSPLIELTDTKKDVEKYLKDFKLDSFFTTSDIDFLCTQIKNSNSFVWDSAYIGQAVIVKLSFVDSVLYSPLEKDRIGIRLPVHYRLSVPLFNRDKTFCYIITYYWCGRMCGQRATYIFKRKNNQWTQYRVSYGPVS